MGNGIFTGVFTAFQVHSERLIDTGKNMMPDSNRDGSHVSFLCLCDSFKRKGSSSHDHTNTMEWLAIETPQSVLI